MSVSKIDWQKIVVDDRFEGRFRRKASNIAKQIERLQRDVETQIEYSSWRGEIINRLAKVGAAARHAIAHESNRAHQKEQQERRTAEHIASAQHKAEAKRREIQSALNSAKPSQS